MVSSGFELLVLLALIHIYRGDYIKKIDGKDIVSKKQFIEKINQGQGKSVILTVQRKEKMMRIKIKPERSKTVSYTHLNDFRWNDPCNGKADQNNG